MGQNSSVEAEEQGDVDEEEAMARYLYAIVPRSDALPEEPGEIYQSGGLNGSHIYSVPQGSVAAVVSDVRESKFRPERRHLSAHHNTLQALMKEGRTLLPVSFGVVAEDPEALRRILSLNEDSFCEQLRRVDGKIEMGLKVMWDVPNIFQYIVEVHPELKRLRDRLFRGGGEPTQDQKIALGRRFEQLLDEDRTTHTEKVCEVLEDVCSEIAENDPRDEKEVMDLACLIARDGQEEFEAGVFEAAKRFDDNYAFDYDGPWPPYNFVHTELKMPQ